MICESRIQKEPGFTGAISIRTHFPDKIRKLSRATNRLQIMFLFNASHFFGSSKWPESYAVAPLQPVRTAREN
jgi:hypothetical protein